MRTFIGKNSFVILFIVIALIFGYYLTSAITKDSHSSMVKIEVQQGDTLWSLSREYAESLSMTENDFIEWVAAANNLNSYSINEGEGLVLPIEEQHMDLFLHDEVQLASEE
ncbi:cell division suppressor protein YneA [Jeotgalibacillus proteolyticus]|uniref:Peptidoglycan-binding protein n=1 Tax=Jeotgalibacillus proteolyticus TaxID=2082395 RepID=A0A2S5GG71_9BACL|nr:LysM peptidoglycan-binding domain-containing protein [Jeotgalibacillus proteolyticus]PPA71968.1 peptidoglycan-binding protein [Jeotgalibacillus proteolyticus]